MALLGAPLSEMLLNLGQNPLVSQPVQPQNTSTSLQTKESQEARVALKFLFSEEGEVFRDFIMNEIVKSVDALSRE